jgi:uncharacterized protein (DUF58 family)
MPQTLLHIDPEVLASIHDFDWAVRSLALGEQMGRKRSKRLGVGLEFSQYRPYSQGDDLRQLDWKMYARTDKFYIKQSDVETNVNVTFIIDTSRSMLYKEDGMSKLDAAKLLSGVLGFVAIENGDTIGLADEASMKAGNDAKHWRRYLNRLQLMKVAPSFTEPYIENRRSKELFVLISDLYDEKEDIPLFIKALKSPRNEVIVFHLMGKKEENLDLGNTVRIKDLETNQSIQLSPSSLLESYKSKVESWKKDLAHDFLINGIDYHSIHFTDTVSDIVNAFLNKRKQLL